MNHKEYEKTFKRADSGEITPQEFFKIMEDNNYFLSKKDEKTLKTGFNSFLGVKEGASEKEIDKAIMKKYNDNLPIFNSFDKIFKKAKK